MLFDILQELAALEYDLKALILTRQNIGTPQNAIFIHNDTKQVLFCLVRLCVSAVASALLGSIAI